MSFYSLLGELTEEDLKKLNERYVNNISEEELDSFCKEAVVLFAERAAVDKYNE